MKDGVLFSGNFDQHTINVRIGPRKEKGAKPDYGNFAFELKKKDLKHFPVLLKFDDNFKFSGLTILRWINAGFEHDLYKEQDFMFQLTAEEAENLRFQIGTSKKQRGGRRYLPYALRRGWVAMFSNLCSGA